jgi:hypothetical protein
LSVKVRWVGLRIFKGYGKLTMGLEQFMMKT